ncbi:MAG TPA: GDSL-type esterase/lipase family protein [Clostridia bacterium]|jgi:lysophospholipase L1-like esterase|nr:GDSL-type esterase/lipase family protein [Clostridia bacterium]
MVTDIGVVEMDRTKKKLIIGFTVGSVLFFLYVLFLMAFFGIGVYKPCNTKATENQIKVACVGDSITFGYGATNWFKNNYPAQLQAILGKEYKVNNYGFSGAMAMKSSTRPYTETNTYKESIKFDADVVIIKLGSNDSRVWKGKEVFKTEYIELVKSYQKPGRTIWLLTPASSYHLYGQTEGPTTAGILETHVVEIRDIVIEVAGELGLGCIDIHTLTSGHPEWYPDGIHPNATGLGEIAKAVAKEAFGK